jgi:hypothetical protein
LELFALEVFHVLCLVMESHTLVRKLMERGIRRLFHRLRFEALVPVKVEPAPAVSPCQLYCGSLMVSGRCERGPLLHAAERYVKAWRSSLKVSIGRLSALVGQVTAANIRNFDLRGAALQRP